MSKNKEVIQNELPKSSLNIEPVFDETEKEVKEKTENTLQEKSDNMPIQSTSLADKFFDKQNDGFQNIDASELAIPFLSICQEKNPQLKEDHVKYIPGLKEGQIFNTNTCKYWDEVVIVPIAFDHIFVEWIPRSRGGGFVGTHKKGSKVVLDAIPQQDNRFKLKLKNGNDLAEVFQLYVVRFDLQSDDVERAILPGKSSQIKKIRNILTLCDERKLRSKSGGFYKPPIYANHFLLSTAREFKDDYEWMGWYVQDLGILSDKYEHIFDIAATYRENISDVVIDYSALESEEESIEQSNNPESESENYKELPY